MLADRQTSAGRQLFRFAVPGLEAVNLALPLTRVTEVTALGTFTPIPFTPAFIHGLVDWRGEVITLINLTRALNPQDDTLQKQSTMAGQRHLVVRLVVGETVEGVAWPILQEAGTVNAPAQARSAKPPVPLASELARLTVVVGEQPLTLLDLDGLAAYIQDFKVSLR